MGTLPLAKPQRIKLSPTAYKKLTLEVFKADDYRCCVCGKQWELQAHHMVARSLGRRDVLSNLVSLCVYCHQRVTEKFLTIAWADPEQRTVTITRRNYEPDR